MTRREFLETGIVLAGGAAISPLRPTEHVKNANQVALTAQLQPESNLLLPHRRHGALWLGTKGDGARMLDAPLRRFLFTRMPTVVVLNGELQGYKELVADTHAQFPDLSVLRYSHAQRVPEGTRVACTMFPYVYKNAKNLALIRTDGTPKIVGEPGSRVVWTDITLAATRDYIVSHIVEQVAEHGADGVAIDGFHAHLETANLRDGWFKARQWPAACAALLQELRAAMPQKLIWFNGIWAREQSVIDAQAELLQYADGASVEFYGYDDMGQTATTDSFETIVQPINAMLEAHPDKTILVRGTSLHATFYDYVTDLRNARYGYGCYLLAKTPGSTFSYGQNFQIARIGRERAGGAALYSYFELPLGQPVEAAVANGRGGWSRMYEGGAVFVAPAGGERQQFQVGFDSWSTTGASQPWGSTLLVRPADAVILLRQRPSLPPATLEANIADSSSEWLVQCETGEYRYRYLTMSVRSTDPDSAVLVRFETDDDPRPFGILEILPDGGTLDPGTHDYPYGYETTLGAAHVRSHASYPPNNVWTTVKIALKTDCAPYPCFRVISVKAIGAVSVGLIRLSGSEPIPQA